MLNSIKNPKSNIKHRLQSTIQNPKSKICPTRHQLLVTRHSGCAAIHHSKFKINNPPQYYQTTDISIFA